MLNKFASICTVAMCASALFACEEDKTDLEISQFDRPQDVAFTCFDSEAAKPLPLNCCKSGFEQGDACWQYAASARLYAFVTQTTSGEVAVVDVQKQDIIDQERRIPYNTFVPVGGQPNDIAASDDGSRVYTVNFETGDLSVIDVMLDEEKGISVMDSPYLSPADSIDLRGAAARMVLVKSPPRLRDRFALVTQPGLGRLTVVALYAEDCPDPEATPEGCVLGYVSLPYKKDADADAEMGHPWALTATHGQSAFVGSYDQPVLWDVQISSLVIKAWALDAPGPVDPADVLNDTIPLSDPDSDTAYTLRAISVEPGLGRWIYAIDNETGGVIAINLQKRTPGSGDAAEIIPVSIPGKARSLALVELEEAGDPAGPLTFNGTFAVAATSRAGFGVVDVEDADTTYFRPHVLRSVVDLSDPDGGVPFIEQDPELTVDGEAVDRNSVDNYLTMVEDEVDGGCDVDGGDDFKAEYDHGVRFRCDPYDSKRERWSFEWEGSIGVSGVGVIANIEEPGDEPWKMLNEDEFKDFCKLELYTEGAVDGFPGDRLVITSEPTPAIGKEEMCDKRYPSAQTLSYRIVGVSKYENSSDVTSEVANVIEFTNDKDSGIPDLIPECFGQAVRYEIRATEQWVVRGSRSSYERTEGNFIAEDKLCKYAAQPPSKMRMRVGEPFENSYIKLRMAYGEEWPNGPAPLEPDEQDTDMTDVEAKMSFAVVGGYEAMIQNVAGTNITDIEFTPDNLVAMVDQDGEGLIFFDMLNSFTVVGGNIN